MKARIQRFEIQVKVLDAGPGPPVLAYHDAELVGRHVRVPPLFDFRF